MKQLSIVIAMVAFAWVFSTPAAYAESCSRWHRDQQSGILLQTCVRANSSSGTYEFRNPHNYAVQVYFTLNYGDGTSFQGGTPIAANSQSGRRACFKCNPANGGVQSWVVRRVDRR